jgi:uncharacterized protein (DUF488 family)
VSENPLIYTIGHSDHPIEAFIALLRQHEVARLVDVRSQPYSRWAGQFNRATLGHDLGRYGIDYRFMGDTLGGMPADPALYDPGQRVPNYQRMAQTPVYRQGIAELLGLACAQQVAIMCSEGDYHQCHRHLLLSQTLLACGASVLHIMPDGGTVREEPMPRQLTMF